MPACPRCGSLLRPDVVWFGEGLPPEALATAIAAARTCDVFLCVGTSTVVEPAASLPFDAYQPMVLGSQSASCGKRKTSTTASTCMAMKGITPT